jgi:hypothetical protein
MIRKDRKMTWQEMYCFQRYKKVENKELPLSVQRKISFEEICF